MERVYFIKASKKELKFASEAIDILVSQKVNCCVTGAHAMHFNKQSIVDGSYSKYLEKVGIRPESFFAKFILSKNWPENDIEHTIRRLRIVTQIGFTPCVYISDFPFMTLRAFDPYPRWRSMRPEYHEGNILLLLEAKIDLFKSVKGRNSLSKVKFDKRLYFGVDI